MRSERNSLVSHLTGYLDALSKDIAFGYLCPSELERDISRLKHELARKGTRILTLDMPALGKHFDKCLDKGLYIPSGLYLGKVPSKGVQVPVFLRDLYLQVFDREGKLRATPKTEIIFLLRTLFMSVKKLDLPFSDRSLHEEICKFLDVEREARSPTLAWDRDYLDDDLGFDHPDLSSGWLGDMENRNQGESIFPGGRLNSHPTRRISTRRRCSLTELARVIDEPLLPFESLVLESIPDWGLKAQLSYIQQVADVVSAQFGDLREETPFELPKHGPGAVAEGGRHINKYAFPNWPRKLNHEFPSDYYAHPSLGECGWDDAWSGDIGSSHEPPSRLVAVPKTQKGPRLIAAEPIAHQFIQQLVRNQLEGRLANTAIRSSISFRDQRVSQLRALDGSIDGSLSTIDLSSASDRLTCWLVERMFRANESLLFRLHACRTRWLSIRAESSTGAYYMPLKKFAPMGSAVTFPVQSIIYATLATAVVMYNDGRPRVTSRSVERASRRVTVFGDDIIVPREHHTSVCDILARVGLKVNHDKTYSEGNFRESCGMDAFRGDDVTPPYLREGVKCDRLSQLGSLVSVRNNFYTKGFWHVAYWLDDSMSKYKRFVPDTPVDSIASGRASFLGANSSICRKRHNELLQRWELQVALPIRKVTPGAMDAVHRLLQWFIEKPLPEINWSSGWVKDEAVKTRLGWIAEDFITGNRASEI